MIRIPKFVKIGPYQFKIRLVPQREFVKNAKNDTIGHTDFERFEILVAKYLPRQKKQEVLLHETIHACHHIPGVNDENKRTDEEWIAAITPTLLLMLRENPLLVEYLR